MQENISLILISKWISSFFSLCEQQSEWLILPRQYCELALSVPTSSLDTSIHGNETVLSWEIGQTTRLLFSQFSWDLNFSVQILDSQILSSWLLSKLRIKSRCFQISKETVNLQFPGTQTTFHNEFTEKSNSVVNIRNIRVRLQEMVAQGGLTVNLFSRKRRLMSTLYSVLLCLEP